MEAVVLLLVAMLGLLLGVGAFEPLAVLDGLLVCAEQRPARPKDKAAMVNVFVIILVLSVEVSESPASRCSRSLIGR
jgi:hypothetical protein